jgi:GntR family transcriptional regulator, rspAB operon transcriptional repressor
MSVSMVPPTIVQNVYEAIRAEIVSGELRPGDPVVEAALSERFGISKTPVREALIRLRRDGLVESAPHRVTRVVTPTVSDIVHVCQLREWIEPPICAECAQDPSAELVARLEDSIDTAERALDESDIETYGDSIRRFTDQLLASSGNHYAVQALQRIHGVLALIANISRETPGRRRRSIDEHRAIVEAIKAQDPDRTAEATRMHLRSIADDSIKAVQHLLEERA